MPIHNEEEGNESERMSKHNRVVYQFLKRNHICVACGEKTNGETVRCYKCNEKYNRNHRRRTKELKIQESLIYCNKCKKNVVKSNGLCDECYKEVVIPDFIKNRR